MLPYGFYLRAMFYNKKLFEEAGVAGPPKTLDEFRAAAEKVSALARQIRLLPARRAGRAERLDDVRRHQCRLERLLQRRRHLDLDRAGLGRRHQVPDRHLQGRAGAEGQRQLGLQRDRRGLLLRHLRHARPGSRRADRHRRADERRGFRRRADAERPGRQELSRPSAMPAGRCSPTASTRTRPGS